MTRPARPWPPARWPPGAWTREIELPVYERLGDTRETALTWGKIADIANQRGEYDEAAELQQQRLEVYKQHGDLDGIASADWGLAQIDLARKDYQSAFPG